MTDDGILDHILYAQAEFLLSDRHDRPICLHPSQIRRCEKLVSEHDRSACEYCSLEEPND